ncbi:MAG: GNAT family N-acetyltransferase, partial [Faecousia sp.]
MNKIILRPIITVEDKNTFVSEIQEAFQNSYVSEFGEFEKTILPTEDIEESFNTKGSEAYI